MRIIIFFLRMMVAALFGGGCESGVNGFTVNRGWGRNVGVSGWCIRRG